MTLLTDLVNRGAISEPTLECTAQGSELPKKGRGKRGKLPQATKSHWANLTGFRSNSLIQPLGDILEVTDYLDIDVVRSHQLPQ